jgi:tetratricopeptide (TPR) repeat protein
VLFFVLAIGPFLGFFNVNYFRFSLVADHFQYLPSLGVIIPASAGIGLLIARFEQRPRAIAYGLCAVLLATLATLSWQQAHFYRDAEALFRGVIEKNPTSWEGRLNVGVELFKKGALDEATFHFQKILELTPNYVPATKRAYVSLGNTFFKRGQWDEAVSYLEKSLKVDPNYAPTHTALGGALHRQGRLSEALKHYEIALQLRPRVASVHSNLAWMLATCSNPFLRDGPRALELAQKADQLSGDANPKVLRSLAAAYAENGRFPEAIEAAGRALHLTLHDRGPSPFGDALRDEIGRYEKAQPYHEVE